MMPRVLLLEPNSRLLAIFRRSLSGIAEVDACGSLDQALEAVRAHPADLVVSEFQLAGGTALDLLKALPESTRPPLVLLASRSQVVDQVRGDRLQFNEIIVKPILLADFRARMEHALRLGHLRRQVASSDVSSLKGRLEDLNLVDLLQSLEISAKTGRIRVADHSGRTAIIDLLDGQVRHAAWQPEGSVEGDAVIYQALPWQSGWFEVSFDRIPEKTTVTTSTQRLLLEGMRLIDEARMGFHPGN